MTDSAQFDRNTLAAVKPGMDSTLAEINAQLELFLGDPRGNIKALEGARAGLHKLLGVLKMVGLDGAAVFCAELELTLGELVSDPAQVSAMHRDVLRRALFGITHYLDSLSKDADNASLRLFPQYQELQQLRGMEMSFEMDLFFPDLDVQLPDRVLSMPVQNETATQLRKLRSQYQQGLLKWMRKDDVTASAQQMQLALEGTIRCEAPDGNRAFWWAAYGLLDCVKLDGMPPEMNVRKLLSRIDQQFRAAIEGNSGDVKPVMNEMLYMIGQSHAVSEHVESIKQVYSLDRYLPELSALSPSEVDQILVTMHEQLRAAEDNWEQCVQGDAAACARYTRHFEQVAQQSDKLDRDVLQYLIKQIQAFSANENTPESARTIAVDIAMVLLLLGSGIEHYRRIGADFQEQAHILSERIQAAIEQQPEDKQRFAELVNLNFQLEQRGDVMSPLASEMLVNLQQVEQGLDAFFNSAIDRDELPELLRLLNQVQGGLHISSLDEAERLLASILGSINRFAQGGDVPVPEEKSALADAMSALEDYIQHLAHGQAADVSSLQVALDEMTGPGQVTGSTVFRAAGTPESPAANEPGSPELQDFELPQDMELTENLELSAIPRDEQPSAVSALELPGDSGSLEFTPAEAPKDLPPIQPPSDEEQELLDIFLEEAQEVLDMTRGNLDTCQLHPDSIEPLVAIRRGFHTLKGSGRMVGLTELGEVAWCVERAMNKWLQDNKSVTPELLGMIKTAAQSFAGWVDELRNRGSAVIEADDLKAAAQHIENGPDAEMQPPDLAFAEPVAPGTEAEIVLPQPSAPSATPLETSDGFVEADLSSPELFNIATTEVKQHVAALHQHFVELRSEVSPVVKYDFMRAAHTLAGVGRTMGFAPVVELSSALEGWLQARLEKSFTPSDSQMAMLEQAINALDEMTQRICDKEVPQTRGDLVSQLLSDVESPDKAPTEPVGSEPDGSFQPNIPAPLEQKAGDLQFPVDKNLPPLTDDDKPDTTSQPPGVTAQILLTPVAVTMAETIETDKHPVFDDVDQQLLPLFLEEGADLCPKISAALRILRDPPHDEQQVQLLKRLLHTLKGSSRMVGAMHIGEIAHEMESRVLAAAQLRDQAGYWDALESDFDHIMELLEALRGDRQKEGQESAPPGRRAMDQPAGIEHRTDRRTPEQGVERAMPGNMLRVRSDVVDRLVNTAGEISVARSHIETEMRVFKESLQELTGSVMRLRHQLREVEIQAESQMQARVSLARENAEQFDPLEFDRFTRLQELTRFMNESVHDVQTVQQSMLKNLEETAAAMTTQGRLNRELQQDLLSVRMVSFSSISDRLYRIVRQSCKELNKRANLELQGTTVELDRSVLEKMIAPFEHLLRNSIVHGLESDEQRAQSGKLPIGEIRLSLRQEGNEVVFEFSDDGAGLDLAKLREKALAAGLLHGEEEAGDQRLAQLIFTAGLSTASEVTEIAGRGIGMDVVRSEISALGGRIDVSSRPGEGTQFLIHLPLTLAVTQVLMVRSGDQRYAIPATMVKQVRQVKPAEMETLYKDRQIEWQDKTYVLHYLPNLLGNPDVAPEIQPRNPVLLLRSGTQYIALHVDELLGNQEAMVKNIGPQLARLPGIAGATVLGDGKVVLILNPDQMAQRIGGGSNAENKVSAAPPRSEPLIMVVDDSLTVRKITSRMLVRAGYQVVTAIDGVDALEKLEEFTPDVMILDIEMPRMDGFSLVRELRRDGKTQHLPIIMITSRTADKHRDYAMQLGVNTYLGKPYQEDELLQRIADFVVDQKFGG